MTTIINKAKEILPTPLASKSKDSPDSSPNGRSIPPEPVQQMPNGDFSEQDAAPALQVHNLARANKGCKALNWSKDLTQDAEDYAKKLASSNKMAHSGVQGQGENLFMSTAEDVKLEDAVNAWLGEEKKYNGEKIGEGKLQDFGHYSESLPSCRRYPIV